MKREIIIDQEVFDLLQKIEFGSNDEINTLLETLGSNALEFISFIKEFYPNYKANKDLVDLISDLEALQSEYVLEASEGVDDLDFKNIYKLHYQYCVNFLSKEFKMKLEDAEGIFIDALMILRQDIVNKKVQFLNNLRSYLVSQCNRLAMNEVKKAEKSTRIEAALNYPDSSSFSDGLDSDLVKLVAKAFNELSDKCHELLTKFYQRELSMKEIADTMGYKTEGTVKTMKYRCMKKLIEGVKTIQHATLGLNLNHEGDYR